MSTRTIIEINHDYLHDLEQLSGDELRALIRSATNCNAELNGSDGRGARHRCGLTTLATRHHSERLDVLASGHPRYAESDDARARR